MKIQKYFIIVSVLVLSNACEKKSSKEDFHQISAKQDTMMFWKMQLKEK